MGLTRLPRRALSHRLAAVSLRMITSVLMAAALAGLGFAGFLTGTLPRPFAVLLEPLSLLLLPGIVPALLAAGSHDFSPEVVLAFAMTFYTLICFWLLSPGDPRRRAPLQ